MPNIPFNLRRQLVTPSSREEISQANAQTIRDETEASQSSFNERTMRLRSLRLARDVDLKESSLVRKVGPRAARPAS
jgi:hypothetical protein